MTNRIAAIALGWLLALSATACDSSGPYHVYWGDVHGHANISDGTGTLDEYFTFARDRAGLDFAFVTDHDFGGAAPWHMPRADWELTQLKADEYTVPGRFVAFAGYEWTSQSKYWTPVEPLFTGPIRYYNHKNVFFPSPVDYIFSAKDARYNSPNLLAAAVRGRGGLIFNDHPDAELEGRDQFDYDPSFYPVIVNTEIRPDTFYYNDGTYELRWESVLRDFLNKGGITGFVGGSDTHEGRPVAMTAVLARELTRPALFDAFRHRRNYAVSNARIVLDFRVNGHLMGEQIEIDGQPLITADVKGTDTIREVVVVRDGSIVHCLRPNTRNVRIEFTDGAFRGHGYYYLRVTQADIDEHGNPSRAWSSPIRVRRKPPAPTSQARP